VLGQKKAPGSSWVSYERIFLFPGGDPALKVLYDATISSPTRLFQIEKLFVNLFQD
jgi:hypothetical protein